jgi:uncharacterized membrane protein YfcA
MEHWEIMIFFFIIALIYASVGFGGGSSYIAILATYAMPFKEMRLVALICNIIVVTGGTIIFIKHKQVNWKRILPIVLVSVPLAFAGGRLKLSQDTFFIILGCSLILAAIMLWVKTERVKLSTTHTNKSNYVKDGLLGGMIGFLSGMVGIGGGIFLSPLLNLMGWDTPKKIAATASIFILFNSVAGIAGQLTVIPSGLNYPRMTLLCVAVFLGGQAGSRLGIIKFNPLVIRRLTALLVFFAGSEVLMRHL